MSRTKQTFDPYITQKLKESGVYGSVYYGIKVKDFTTKRCFDILEKRGFTQEQIGMLLGVSQPMVSKYKCGISEMPAYKWITLICYTDPEMFICFEELANCLHEEEKNEQSK